MKNTTKILALIIALAMSLTLAACGDEPENETENTNEIGSTTPELSQETPPKEETPPEESQPQSQTQPQHSDVPITQTDDTSNVDKNIEVYSDGETTVTVDYSAETITVRSSTYRNFTQSENVITAYIDAGIVEAPDYSYQGQEYFVTATIEGDTMYFEEVFVLTRDPGSSSSISVTVPELSFYAVLTRVE